MIVRPFTDEYAAIADLVGGAADELRGDDAASAPPRWIAVDGASGAIAGVVTARTRPDGRTFLGFGATPPDLFVYLADAAASHLGTVYSFARDERRRGELTAAGFQVEIATEQLSVPFSGSLDRLRRARLPDRYLLAHVDELDEVKLVALDNTLRQDVPGTEGWEGTIDMWRSEIASDEYDRNGYLIAVERATNEYCGLVRFWRNADGPRLGLLAVVAQHRRSLLAGSLLRAGLQGAADWGHSQFTTETSPANRGTYPALLRVGAAPLGRRYQLVLNH